MATRRTFLKATAGTAALGPFAFFNPVTAAETRVTPDIVQLSPEIEPVVRLIENTPREKCFEMMVEQLRRGLPYRRFLAALFLAGIRNVNPQPPGFKFHCVFVIHAAHQLSLDAPVHDRLLPLFWALDNFKASQERDVKEGDFQLKPVRGRIPSPANAWTDFHDAMDDWDEERADWAIVALVRSKGAQEIIEGLWRYGARDYRNIGHKAIFVANTWRTLQTIGWQHAEPCLRSLVLGLLDFGKNERVNNYAFEDQSYLPNLDRVNQNIKQLSPNWTQRLGNEMPVDNLQATSELLQVICTGKTDEATKLAMKQLTKGSPQSHQGQSVWDAVHLAAGELMMQQPGIFGIHTVTSVNGLRYAYETAANQKTRLLLLLQGIGWMCQFRNFMASNGRGLKPIKVTAEEPAKSSQPPEKAIEEIFAVLSKDRAAAAKKVLQFVGVKPDSDVYTNAAQQLAQTARRLIFRKGTDAHDYKWASAIFEDFQRVSIAHRPFMLATAVYNLRGSTEPDSPVMQRAQDVLKSL